MFSRKTTISLVLGCFGALGCLLPILGIMITVAGLVSGIRGYQEDLSRRARVGVALNVVFLVVSIVWLTVVVTMRFRNQWFFY